MHQDRMPSFVIVGAAKSATTWLAHNLRQHREIFVPDAEIHYFSRHFDRDVSWYTSHFEGARAGQVVGERSNTYFTDPEVPKRLKARLPDARLIVQLRNPIERAYSDYCMHLRRGAVSPDVDLYLDIKRTPVPHLLWTGLYYRNLSRFLDEFPTERVRVIFYDDIAGKPAMVFQDVCAHIGVDAQGSREVIAERVYDKETPEMHHRIRAVRLRLGPRPSYPAISRGTRDRLRDFYRDDLETLSSILGRDLGGWLASDAAGEAA